MATNPSFYDARSLSLESIVMKMECLSLCGVGTVSISQNKQYLFRPIGGYLRKLNSVATLVLTSSAASLAGPPRSFSALFRIIVKYTFASDHFKVQLGKIFSSSVDFWPVTHKIKYPEVCLALHVRDLLPSG